MTIIKAVLVMIEVFALSLCKVRDVSDTHEVWEFVTFRNEFMLQTLEELFVFFSDAFESSEYLRINGVLVSLLLGFVHFLSNIKFKIKC